jgi:predicted chitinase
MNLIKNIYIIIVLSILNKSIQCQTICNNDYGNQRYNGSCKQVDDCLGAALKGNCLNSLVCCIKDDKQAPNITENSFIKKNLFLNLVGNTPRNEYLYNFFAESMYESEILNQYRAAAYFATLVGETNYFKEFESKVDDPDINADLGNNETSDGLKFRGRGGIWLRGKTNYILANSKLSSSFGICFIRFKVYIFLNYGLLIIIFQIFNKGINILSNPEKIAFPSYAFKVASWFWKENAFIITSDQKATKGSNIF